MVVGWRWKRRRRRRRWRSEEREFRKKEKKKRDREKKKNARDEKSKKKTQLENFWSPSPFVCFSLLSCVSLSLAFERQEPPLTPRHSQGCVALR